MANRMLVGSHPFSNKIPTQDERYDCIAVQGNLYAYARTWGFTMSDKVRVYPKKIEEQVKTVAAIAKYSVILDTTTLTIEIYTRSACRAGYVFTSSRCLYCLTSVSWLETTLGMKKEHIKIAIEGALSYHRLTYRAYGKHLVEHLVGTSYKWRLLVYQIHTGMSSPREATLVPLP